MIRKLLSVLECLVTDLRDPERREGVIHYHRNERGQKIGQAWLHFFSEPSAPLKLLVTPPSFSLQAEWVFPSKTFNVGFRASAEGEETFTWKLCVPPVALYFGLDSWKLGQWISKQGFIPAYEDRELALRIFDWALWWSVWANTRSFFHQTPQWRDGNWHVLDTLFGKSKYRQRVLEELDVIVPLPEKSYRAKLVIQEQRWKRPRWFARTRATSHVTFTDSLPMPYDGALRELSSLGEDMPSAVGDVVRRVLERRIRQGGPNWKPKRESA